MVIVIYCMKKNTRDISNMNVITLKMRFKQNNEPIIITSAPNAIAFAMSPENLIPPSAITGILYFFATSETL